MMRGFWKSKTTWLAIATVAYHVFAVLTGHATLEQAIQSCTLAIMGAFGRDALKAHAEHVATTALVSGLGVSPSGDGGEV